MREIGILTFHRPVNYGAFLQAFSLREKLRETVNDCNVEIIDFISQKERNNIYLNILRTGKHAGLKNMLLDVKKTHVFRKSLRFLSLSKYKGSDKKLEELYKYIDSKYDFLIIGSDAVFNWHQTHFPTAFIPNYSFNHCKILSYAASVHGMKYREESAEKIEECRRSFETFEFLGVRDVNTENFIHYCSNSLMPVHCCDPTLFLNITNVIHKAGDYKNRILKKYNMSLSKPYIVLMIKEGKFAEEIAKKYTKSHSIISLFKANKYADCFLYDLNPFEWAAVIGGSSLIITSYFHGTLLGLIQGVPVIVEDCSNYNDDVYEGKLKDLLIRRLSLEELYFDNTCEDQKMVDKMLYVSDQAINGSFSSRIHSAIEHEKDTHRAFVTVLNSL